MCAYRFKIEDECSRAMTQAVEWENKSNNYDQINNCTSEKVVY